jgi:hypothetical protein
LPLRGNAPNHPAGFTTAGSASTMTLGSFFFIRGKYPALEFLDAKL